MKTTIGKTLTVLAILVLATAIFFAGWMVSHVSSFGNGWMMGGNGNYGSGSMMGGVGGYGSGGMMSGGYASGGMMSGGFGGMMGGNGYSNAAPVSIDQMRTAAETYVQNSGLPGLEVGEIMIFDNNAYAIIMETDTGLGAFELLMNSSTQIAFPEYGPNMMWNLKYGAMSNGGMMGDSNGGMMGVGNGGSNNGGMMGSAYNSNTNEVDISADMPVTKEKALSIAQAYLEQYVWG